MKYFSNKVLSKILLLLFFKIELTLMYSKNGQNEGNSNTAKGKDRKLEITCDDGFYPAGGVCHIPTDAVEGYYFDSTLNEFKQCNSGCTVCTSSDEYPLTDDLTKCFKSTDISPHYFLDETLWKFSKCSDSCLQCQDNTTFGCDICDIENSVESNKYYPYEMTSEDFLKCAKKTDTVNGYYYQTSNNKFVSCDLVSEGCSSCTATTCNSCKSEEDYYIYQDELLKSKCRKKTEELTGYFFNSASTPNKFEVCSSKCQECSSGETGTISNCLSCKPTYYLEKDSTNGLCLLSSEITIGNFLDSENEISKCGKECKKCSSTSSNCDECNDALDFYPLDSTPLKCISSDKALYSSLALNDLNHYISCYASCELCLSSGIGTKDNPKCTQCKEGYYPKESNSSFCMDSTWLSDASYKNLYLNYDYTSSGQKKLVYSECDISCETCKGLKDQCETCNSALNYIPIDGTKKCAISSDTIAGHYYNSSTNKFEKCYKKCYSCNGYGDESNMNCILCNDPYQLESPGSTKCLQTCYFYHYVLGGEEACTDGKLCPDNYPYLTQSNECSNQCNLPKVLFDNTCLNGCPEGTSLQEAIEGETITITNECLLDNETIEKPEEVEIYNDTETFTSDLSALTSEDDIAILEETLNTFSLLEDEETNKLEELTEENNSTTTAPEVIKSVCTKQEYQTSEVLEDISNLNDQVKLYATNFSDTENHVDIIKGGSFEILIFKNESCSEEFSSDSGSFNNEECESKIRDNYGLSSNEKFITVKLSQETNTSANKITFYLYNGKDGSPFNMDLCSDKDTLVSVPLMSNREIDTEMVKKFTDLGYNLFDINDRFFKDICISYQNEQGKDVTLDDRIKLYYQNATICALGCQFQGINPDTLEAQCSCPVNQKIINEIFDNPITGDVFNLIKTSNIQVLKCLQAFKHLKNNKGFWIMFIFLLVQIGITIYYIRVGTVEVKIYLVEKIYNVIFPPKRKKQQNNMNEDFFDDNAITMNCYGSPTRREFKGDEDDSYEDSPENRRSVAENSFHIHNSMKEINGENNSNDKRKTNGSSMSPSKPNRARRPSRFNKIKRKTESMRLRTQTAKGNYVAPEVCDEDFIDEELDEMDVYDAAKFDKRPFCSYYWNLLKYKQMILSIIFQTVPYQPRPLKMISLVLSLILYFALNAFFFTQGEMSEILYSEEEEGFVFLVSNQINICLYSSCVCILIEFLINFLLSHKEKIKAMLKITQTKEEYIQRMHNILRSIKIRSIIFFIINYSFSLFSVIYMACFAYCYPGCQLVWIYSSLLTLLFNLTFPFVYCLLISAMRKIGIACRSEVFFSISTWLAD